MSCATLVAVVLAPARDERLDAYSQAVEADPVALVAALREAGLEQRLRNDVQLGVVFRSWVAGRRRVPPEAVDELMIALGSHPLVLPASTWVTTTTASRRPRSSPPLSTNSRERVAA